MLTKSLLKDIIADNERHINANVHSIVTREGLRFPDSVKKVVTVYGVRRSGKTYVLYDIFKHNPHNSLYIDFEDERLIDFEVKDFERLLEAFFELKPQLVDQETVFLFDEIQNVPGWERFCRRLVERENARVFVSGSSSKIMPAEIHTALRGRSWGVELLPFSFREYATAHGVKEFDEFGRERAGVKKAFADYLRWGGFPELSVAGSEPERAKIIKEYLGAMFFKDLVERYQISNIPLLDALIDVLLSSPSLKLSLTSFYKKYKGKFPFSKDSLHAYYKYVQESLLVFETRLYSTSSYKRMRNPPKLYLVDNGIARRIASEDVGRLLENAVYLEFKRRGCEMYYYDDGNECDFVVRAQDDSLSCAQVTYELTDQNREREFKGLLAACHSLNVRRASIFTFDDAEQSLTVDDVTVHIVPCWRWMLSHE